MHIAFLNTQHSKHSSEPKSLIPIISRIKIVPIVIVIGKGQGRNRHRGRETANFKTIRSLIRANIAFRVHLSIDQSQLASGRHVILLQYRNLKWGRYLPFILQDPCQKSRQNKKKHLKTLKCLKNKEIKFKNYLCKISDILAQVHPPGCTYNHLFTKISYN